MRRIAVILLALCVLGGTARADTADLLCASRLVSCGPPDAELIAMLNAQASADVRIEAIVTKRTPSGSRDDPSVDIDYKATGTLLHDIGEQVNGNASDLCGVDPERSYPSVDLYRLTGAKGAQVSVTSSLNVSRAPAGWHIGRFDPTRGLRGSRLPPDAVVAGQPSAAAYCARLREDRE